MSLTIKEFRRLPRHEQNKRYGELSNHDKFIARMEDWGAPDRETPAEEWIPTKEDAKRLVDMLNGKDETAER